MSPKEKKKDEEVHRLSWGKFFRNFFACTCVQRRKKREKKGKDADKTHGTESSSSSTMWHSTWCTVPTSVVSPTSVKLLGKEQINATKLEEVKKTVERVISTNHKNPRVGKKAGQMSRVVNAISRRDKNLLNERRKKLKQRKGKKAKEHKVPSEKTTILPSPGTSKSTGKQHAQLPIGVRGYAPESFKRPNRFALRYVPEGQILKDADLIEQASFNDLFAKLCSLNYNFEVAMRSYQDIVKSLIVLQVPEKKQKDACKKWNSEVPKTLSSREAARIANETVEQALEAVRVERLLDPKTKRRAMEDLQRLVEEINVALDEIHVFYDDEEEVFDDEEYAKSEFRINFESFRTIKGQVERLLGVVEALVEAYSKELIHMFNI